MTDTDARGPESESISSSNENETLDEGRAFRESAKKHNKPSKKLRAKFVKKEKVWVAVPGQKGKVMMRVVDSKQGGNWSYELQDNQGDTYYQNGSQWIREIYLEEDNSPDEWISNYETMRLYNTQTWYLENTLEGHSSPVTAVAFSPNGELIASASWDKTVRLWDTQTGSLQNTLKGHSSLVTAVAFSPNGELIASASEDRTVRLWNIQTWPLQNLSEGQNESSIEPGLLSKAGDDTGYRLKTYNSNSGSRQHMEHVDQQSSIPTGAYFEWTRKYSCEGLKFLKTSDKIGDLSIILKPNPQSHFYIATHLSKALQKHFPEFGLKILELVAGILCLFYNSNPGSKYFLHQTIDSVRHLQQDSEFVKKVHVRCLLARSIGYKSSGTYRSTYPRSLVCLDLDNICSSNPTARSRGTFSWTPGFITSTGMLQKPSRFEPPKDAKSYCWKELFKYAHIVYPPFSNSTDETRSEGLMIDFDILVDLAAVDRTMMTEDGPILFGFDTALIPLDPPESRRWHFLATDGKQITLTRIKRFFNGSRSQGQLNPQYCTGSVYVGWCINPIVTLCTKKGDSGLINSCAQRSGVPQSGPIEQAHERSKAKDISFLGRGGISSISFGLSTSRKSEQKWKSGPTVKKLKVEENFQGVLNAAEGLKCTLWDQTAQKAWFLPAISGLLFTSLQYIEYNGYTFQEKLFDGQLRDKEIIYARESPDAAYEAKLH